MGVARAVDARVLACGARRPSAALAPARATHRMDERQCWTRYGCTFARRMRAVAGITGAQRGGLRGLIQSDSIRTDIRKIERGLKSRFRNRMSAERETLIICEKLNPDPVVSDTRASPRALASDRDRFASPNARRCWSATAPPAAPSARCGWTCRTSTLTSNRSALAISELEAARAS